MFDLGFTELLLVAVIALIVLGPERLPKAARFAGLWVRRARAQWDSVRVELERELAAEELKRNLQESRDAIQTLGGELRQAGQDAQRGLESMGDQVRDPVPTDRRDGQPTDEPDADEDDVDAAIPRRPMPGSGSDDQQR